MFEGQPSGLRPVYRSSNVSSGLMKTVGKMVGHSLLMDNHGFPFLSKCCYFYLCGKVELAQTLVTDDDLSANVKAVITEVNALS